MPPDSLAAALRDEFGADSEETSDAVNFVIFGGFETMTCAVTGVLNRLAVETGALQKVRGSWSCNGQRRVGERAGREG